MPVTLLDLFREDAETAAAALTSDAGSATRWLELFKDYLDDLQRRYNRAAGVPAWTRRAATGCLNLAVSAANAGAGAVSAGAPAEPSAGKPLAAAESRSATLFAAFAFAIFVANMILTSAAGAVSTLVLLAVFLYCYWESVGLLARRFKAGPPPRDRVPDPASRPRTIKDAVEAVARRTGDILTAAEPPPPAPPPLGPGPDTLEFFQDLLEAKLGGDKEYAFQKISRTLGRVLAQEGIGFSTDAEGQGEMFRFDTIAGSDAPDSIEVVRPAMIRDQRCLLPGYARRYAQTRPG